MQALKVLHQNNMAIHEGIIYHIHLRIAKYDLFFELSRQLSLNNITLVMCNYCSVHAVGENHAIICNVSKTASVLLPTQFYTLLSRCSASKPNKPHYISLAQCGIFVCHIKYSAGRMPYLQMYVLSHL